MEPERVDLHDPEWQRILSVRPGAASYAILRLARTGFVAFWHRCTHMGCTVPYRPDFEWSVNGRAEKGLFRCPCHGSTYSRDEADIVFGPAPRPLDTLPVQIKRGRVLVTVSPGSERRREPHQPARVAAA
jgi:Rieske Fe-S protein